jgi:hypothetical protein
MTKKLLKKAKTGGNKTDSTSYYKEVLVLAPKMKAHFSGGNEKKPLNQKRYEAVLKEERAAKAYLGKKKTGGQIKKKK